MYLICFFGSAVVSIAVSLSSDYVLFATGMALLGAFGSVYHPLANSLISQKVEAYGRAMGIHGAAGNVGIAATPILAGAIASFGGWRQSYVFFGLLGVALAIWSLFIDLSNAPQKTNISVPDTNHHRRCGLLATFFPLPLVLIYLANMLNAFCFQGTITFLPTYMAHQTSFQVFSLDNVAIGGMLSGIVLSIGVAGQYMGGVLGGKARLERNLALIGALAFPFLLAMSFQRNAFLLIAALGYYLLNFCMQPMCNVLVARYTTAETRGTAFGIFFFIASGAGSFSATFAGYLAQRFGLASIFQGMCAAVILLFLMAFLLFRVTKSRTATPPGAPNGPPSPIVPKTSG
jgi:MFS family permease